MSNELLIMCSIIFRSLTAITALAAACVLAFKGKDGWGWFIFAAILIGSYSLTYKGE